MTGNFHQEKILVLPPALIGEIFIHKLDRGLFDYYISKNLFSVCKVKVDGLATTMASLSI